MPTSWFIRAGIGAAGLYIVYLMYKAWKEKASANPAKGASGGKDLSFDPDAPMAPSIDLSPGVKNVGVGAKRDLAKERGKAPIGPCPKAGQKWVPTFANNRAGWKCG